MNKDTTTKLTKFQIILFCMGTWTGYFVYHAAWLAAAWITHRLAPTIEMSWGSQAAAYTQWATNALFLIPGAVLICVALANRLETGHSAWSASALKKEHQRLAEAGAIPA